MVFFGTFVDDNLYGFDLTLLTKDFVEKPSQEIVSASNIRTESTSLLVRLFLEIVY